MSPRELPNSLYLDNSQHDDDDKNNSSPTSIIMIDDTPGDDVPILAASRHLLKPNGSIVGDEIASAILPLFPTLLSAIPTTASNTHNLHRPALACLDGRQSLTHERIVEFGQHEFANVLQTIISSVLGINNNSINKPLPQGRKPRIGLILPNGPELALALLVTAQYCTAVPLNANAPSSEWQADLAQCGADLVIGMYYEKDIAIVGNQDWSSFRSVHEVANQLDIPYCGLIPSTIEAGIFRLVPYFQTTTVATNNMMPLPPNAHDDPALVLFTSGTTGQKKLVPHLLCDLLTAATTIALSWNLQTTDVNCNMMPLFHIGGIVRQILSPVFSGGCVICCPSFDPAVFWTLLEKRAFTWYYAAPTMHQLILQTGKDDGYIRSGGTATLNNNTSNNTLINNHLTLRMIANAAGGLLPSLAEELKQTFHANVLPSYGMTECMPISSPPATYQLEKPGTSGVPVGPQVAILNLVTCESLPVGEEGPICVRGQPCFRGYGQSANADLKEAPKSSFIKGGWFDTGDLGYLDEDGYLFITGRSKEVINRGGEIISPMEVEEAVARHPDVVTCAALSAPHDVLQEVVGLALVIKAGRPRLDLPTLHQYLGERLAAPKWPQCLIYMDDLPKSHTNKLLRVKLANRLGLPEFSDDMSPLQRTFEATCPPKGTALDVPIPAKRVVISTPSVTTTLHSQLVTKPNQQLLVVPHPSRPESLVCYLANIDRLQAIQTAMNVLDQYAVPTHFVDSTFEVVSTGQGLPLPHLSDARATILQGGESTGPVDPIVQRVQSLFVEVLNLDYLPSPIANFFHLGGSSMLASQMASKIRKLFAVACNGSEVFQHSSPAAMSKLIRQRSDSLTASTDEESASATGRRSPFENLSPFGKQRLKPRPSLWASLFQLVPMFLVFPIWQVSRYLLFLRLLLWSIDNAPGTRDLGKFVAAYVVFHTIWITVTPLIFVAIKWIVIGRYKAGRYPIWGGYYLRWWFVDICRKLILRGIWGSHDVLLNTYYRMLGAEIASGAKISLECDVAEFDLVTVGRDASIEMTTLRGFGVDNGAMSLGPVEVGNNASLGWKSVVAPHTKVPDNCHLGPATSSYDIGEAMDPKFANVNRRNLTEPHVWIQVMIGGTITFMVNAFSQIPPLFVLFFLLRRKGQEDGFFETLGDLMAWLCEFDRIKFYIGIRIARALLSPFFYMAAALFVKWTIIGKFQEGPRNSKTQLDLLRYWLAATLFSRKKIQSVTDLIGRHYELVSILYRLLGAKVGKRVYWPGHQPVFSGEFDLLEIGDDVVFGSRSAIFVSSRDSSQKVTLCAGCNVADNCVVFPGSVIGKNAVLGSNSVCPAGWYLPQDSIWLGSKGCEPMCLDQGTEDFPSGRPIMASEIKRANLPMTGDASTARPFGKAFYRHKANYFVWPLHWIVLYTFVVNFVNVTIQTLPTLGALHSAATVLYGRNISERDYRGQHYSFGTIYFVWLSMYLFTNFGRVCISLAIELTAKWTLIGKRQPGVYNYDISSYAQRWELYQIISKVRKFSRLSLLDFFSGTPFMSAYFRWNGGVIGKDCCLYPSGADPFLPEPDLVQMGNRCVIDCAAIVCHLNTRGNFELRKITLEDDCTLRTLSRIQQGVYMERGSQLMERSLAMTGEVIEAYSVWQGCPASWWYQNRTDDEDVVVDNVGETTLLLSGGSSSYN